MNNIEIVILAAGLGTRMKSEIPKVMHKIAGAPMIEHLLDQIILSKVQIDQINIVVGYKKEIIQKYISENKKYKNIKLVFSTQSEQLGTGHAVKCALEHGGTSKIVAVFNGDLPLIEALEIKKFIDFHLNAKSMATLASTKLNDPGAYGRVIRSGKKFTKVVEMKDANPAQRKINEINGGVYLFDRSLLNEALSKAKNKNANKEYYLPDVFEFVQRKKKKIEAYCMSDSNQLLGANNMKELAETQKVLYLRNAEHWMSEGVFIHDPESAYIGSEVKFSKGCVVYPNVRIHGKCEFSENVSVGSNCDLKNISVGSGTELKNGTFAEDAVVGNNCKVGPMAHLRPGTVLKDDVKIGNFVELKQATIGAHTSASHLSYIGDAEVGENVNFGCGFVTCNFDGTVRNGSRKHKSKIGNNVFIGSDSQVVAPIEIADGTFIASGSTVTHSVSEPYSLVFARTRQTTKPGYAKKYTKKE